VRNFEAVNDTTARLVTIGYDTFTVHLRGNGITALRRRSGTDSVEYLKNSGGWQFAFIDSTGGAITDGDKGDITVSGGGLTWTIDNNAITTTKINNGAVTIPKIGATGTPDNTTVLYGDGTWATAGGVISNPNIAYVTTSGNDGTGQVNRPDKPFLTINGALDALPSTGGIVDIGIGEFLVPDTAKIKSDVWFRGSGMPSYNAVTTVSGPFNTSTTAITRMNGGTRLHGLFSIPYNRNNVDMSDLGVDNGSDWINANNGGTALDCIAYAQRYGAGLNSADGFHLLQTSASPRTGINVWNVSALVKGPTDLVHAFIFENMENPIVNNIYSCYGFAGIVIKTIRGVFTNLHAMGHSDAGIYLKSNDYSYCYGVVVDGFEVKSVGTNDGGGVHINANDAGSPGLFECTLANGIVTQTKYGVKSLGSLIDGVHIDNVKTALTQGDGFNLPALYYSLINNCNARACGGDGFNIGNAGVGKGPFISNCLSASNGGDGFEIGGSQRVELDNIYSEANAGVGIRSTGSNVYVGVHTEVNNTSGPTTGTLNTKLTVGNGGTGNITLTPYALMAGGTTATGAMQQVSGLGTSGQVLTSNGAGALPTFQNASASITSINSHTGPAITIQSGTATSIDNSVGNTVTVNVTPSSNSLPHTLDALFTTQGNTGTSETDLYSYSVPANKLAIDGRTVNFEIDGEFNDNTATSQLKLYFGGNVTLNTGAVNISTANTAWKLTGYIIRTSSTTAHVTYWLECPGLATQKFLGYSNLTSLDFTAGNIFKVTAQAGGAGGGNNDITAHSWQVLYKPQPQ
jgi:hypothetical protein